MNEVSILRTVFEKLTWICGFVGWNLHFVGKEIVRGLRGIAGQARNDRVFSGLLRSAYNDGAV